MRRIAVTGTSGSGKTTFARGLAERLALRHVELDALYWGPGWTGAHDDAFRSRLAAAIEDDGWVTDGNYSGVRDVYLSRVDTVIWLDLPMRVCLWRVTRRTFERARSREDLWGTGNRESWRQQLGRDSLIWWVLTTHGRRRRENEARFAEPAFASVTVLRFPSSAEADAWLRALPAAPQP